MFTKILIKTFKEKLVEGHYINTITGRNCVRQSDLTIAVRSTVVAMKIWLTLSMTSTPNNLGQMTSHLIT